MDIKCENSFGLSLSGQVVNYRFISYFIICILSIDYLVYSFSVNGVTVY